MFYSRPSSGCGLSSILAVPTQTVLFISFILCLFLCFSRAKERLAAAGAATNVDVSVFLFYRSGCVCVLISVCFAVCCNSCWSDCLCSDGLLVRVYFSFWIELAAINCLAVAYTLQRCLSAVCSAWAAVCFVIEISIASSCYCCKGLHSASISEPWCICVV